MVSHAILVYRNTLSDTNHKEVEASSLLFLTRTNSHTLMCTSNYIVLSSLLHIAMMFLCVYIKLNILHDQECTVTNPLYLVLILFLTQQ